MVVSGCNSNFVTKNSYVSGQFFNAKKLKLHCVYSWKIRHVVSCLLFNV
jgi:hypothetical protein